MAFPDLFHMARDKDISVARVWVPSGAGRSWNMQFLRAFILGMDSVVLLLNLIQNFVVSLEGIRLDGLGGVEEGVLKDT